MAYWTVAQKELVKTRAGTYWRRVVKLLRPPPTPGGFPNWHDHGHAGLGQMTGLQLQLRTMLEVMDVADYDDDGGDGGGGDDDDHETYQEAVSDGCWGFSVDASFVRW